MDRTRVDDLCAAARLVVPAASHAYSGVLRARTGAMTVRCLTLRYSHVPDIMAVGGTGRPR